MVTMGSISSHPCKTQRDHTTDLKSHSQERRSQEPNPAGATPKPCEALPGQNTSHPPTLQPLYHQLCQVTQVGAGDPVLGPAICLSTYHLSTFPPTYAPIYPPLTPSIYPPIYPPTCSLTHFLMHLFTQPLQGTCPVLGASGSETDPTQPPARSSQLGGEMFRPVQSR